MTNSTCFPSSAIWSIPYQNSVLPVDRTEKYFQEAVITLYTNSPGKRFASINHSVRISFTSPLKQAFILSA